MGKRSDFARIDRDFYPTPIEAVRPLFPHLTPPQRYIEPCAGDGALIDHLKMADMECIHAFDIHPNRVDVSEADALQLTDVLLEADCIITNPPWNRKLLHPMIEHFSAIRPTWLLFDSDWIHTQQSAPYMASLQKIVSIGRIKWIPGSKMTGKDNCAWHLFDKNNTQPTEFWGRIGKKLLT